MSLAIFTFYYNRENEVDLSIQSILESAPMDSKIFLVDDGSTDGTGGKLDQYSDDHRVEVIHKSNSGLSATLAELLPIKLAEGGYEFVAIHGSGDICAPDKFRKQIDYLRENDNVVAVGCGYKLYSAKNRTVLSVQKGFHVASEESLRREVPFTHGSVVYRTKALLRAGGYDASFVCCQDWELYFRLQQYGKLVRLADVLYQKMLFEDGVSFKPSKRRHQLKYKRIVTSGRDAKGGFYSFRNRLSNEDIDVIIPDRELKSEFQQQQLLLIAKGEFNLAAQWCEYIRGGRGTFSVQQFLRRFLVAMAAMRFPPAAMALLYRVVSKYLRGR